MLMATMPSGSMSTVESASNRSNRASFIAIAVAPDVDMTSPKGAKRSGVSGKGVST
jgi:hypothetical protein